MCMWQSWIRVYVLERVRRCFKMSYFTYYLFFLAPFVARGKHQVSLKLACIFQADLHVGQVSVNRLWPCGFLSFRLPPPDRQQVIPVVLFCSPPSAVHVPATSNVFSLADWWSVAVWSSVLVLHCLPVAANNFPLSVVGCVSQAHLISSHASSSLPMFPLHTATLIPLCCCSLLLLFQIFI